jgi:serine/threonine-protein kinase
VYEVHDERTGRRRALKVLHETLAADDEARTRFDEEARVSAGVRSPHVVEVVDAGVDEETRRPYVVMTLVDGTSAEDHLATGPLPLGEATAVLRQVARGLDALHAAGVVHRDLKPGNVVLSRDADGLNACIVDLGVAKVVQAGPAPTTRALGTPLYMAPEQIEGCGDVDARADVYALGQLTFTLLVGRPYFDDEQRRGAVHRVLLDTTRGLPDPASVRAARFGASLPPGFDAWFDAVTARDRGRRPATASGAIARLEASLAAGDSASRRGSQAILLGAALVLVLLIGIGTRRRPNAAALLVRPPPDVASVAVVAAPLPTTSDTRAAPPAPSPPATVPRSSPTGRRPTPRATASSPRAPLPDDPTDVR